MKIFYSGQFPLPLPAGHRFPMRKYAMLRDRVLASGLATEASLGIPAAASPEQLTLAHSPSYCSNVQTGTLSRPEIRRLGFPWSPQLVERSRRSCGATIEACRAALAEGVAVNLAGGTHHAFRDRGEGFSVFNDSAVAARVMQAEERVRRIVILDCDVHQGNGTASILQGDSTIFTFSIHGARNFPFHKEQSDLDIALEDETGDQEYLARLEEGLETALCRSRAELAVYLSGADPYRDDRLGRLALSKPGLAERDFMVLERCRKAGIPVAVTMGGGYARRIEDIVDIHFRTVELAAAFLDEKRPKTGRVGPGSWAGSSFH